jgi:hypothetical protein
MFRLGRRGSFGRRLSSLDLGDDSRHVRIPVFAGRNHILLMGAAGQ